MNASRVLGLLGATVFALGSSGIQAATIDLDAHSVPVKYAKETVLKTDAVDDDDDVEHYLLGGNHEITGGDWHRRRRRGRYFHHLYLDRNGFQ